MPMADDVPWWGAGLLAALAAIVTGVVASYLPNWKERIKGRAKGRRDALEEWQDITERHKAQIDRLDTALTEAREVADKLHGMHADCQEQSAMLEQQLHFVYEHMCRLHKTMTAGGIDPGDLPTLPPRTRRPDDSGANLLVKTVRQSEKLAKEANKAAKKADSGNNPAVPPRTAKSDSDNKAVPK